MLVRSVGLTEILVGMSVRNWLNIEQGGMQQQCQGATWRGWTAGSAIPRLRRVGLQEKGQIHATMFCCRSAERYKHIDVCLAGRL
jgi:hypothetical protein